MRPSVNRRSFIAPIANGRHFRVIKKHLITSARGETHGQRRTTMSHITTEDPATLRLPFKRNSLTVSAIWPLTSYWISAPLSFEVLYRCSGAAWHLWRHIFLISKFFTAFTDMGTGIMLIPDARSVQKVSSVLLFCMRLSGHPAGDRQLCRHTV